MDDRWLKQALYKGLQTLVVLNLEGKPAAENVTKTADVWLVALKSSRINWDPAQDEARLAQAFAQLLLVSSRWPNPKDLMDVLPARKPLTALPSPPPYPAEKAKANLAKIKAMLKGQHVL